MLPSRWIGCAVLSLSVLGGCGGARRDPIVAQLAGPPLRAVLRSHEYTRKLACAETGLSRLSCLFKSERRSCLYLELGAAADGAFPAVRPGADRCEDFPASTRRAWLLERPGPWSDVALAVDSDGSRLAWREGGRSWQVLYLVGGELLDMPPAGALAALLGGGSSLSNVFGSRLGTTEPGALDLRGSGGVGLGIGGLGRGSTATHRPARCCSPRRTARDRSPRRCG